MSDGGMYADWVADNEHDLIEDFMRDGGKNVDLYIVSAILDHYEGLVNKPKTAVDLVDALINKDRDLEKEYLKYIEARYAELCDRSMVLNDRENER